MSPKITFQRVERDSDANRTRREKGERGIVYDFDVYVDGERRGVLHKIVYGGRGYELYDLNFNRVGPRWQSCDKQQGFEDHVRGLLPQLPTVEQAFWDSIRDGELIVIDHMAAQAREEAHLYGRYGWATLQALRSLTEAVEEDAATSPRSPDKNLTIAAVEVATRKAHAALAKAEGVS